MAEESTTYIDNLELSSDYVDSLKLAEPSWDYGNRVNSLRLETADDPRPRATGAESAEVNAGSLASFVEGLTDENKADVKNSTLLAQLAANYQYDRYADAFEWTKFYISVLENVGWNIPQFDFSDYKISGTTVQMDKVVLEILAAVATGNEIAIVNRTLDALSKLDGDSKQLTIWDSNASDASKGNFQIYPVSQTPENSVVMIMTGMQFDATTTHGRFLFWSWSSTSIKIRTAASRFELNRDVYDQVRAAIIKKLGDKAEIFVADLPI